MSEIKERLKKVREVKGLSVSAFSLEIGEKSDRLSNMERGKQRITSDVLSALVVSYGVNAYWLLTGEGQMFAGQGGSLSEEIPNQAYTQSELINNQRKARIESFIEHWFETMPDDDQVWLEGQMKRCITEYNDFISDKTIRSESRKSRA